MDEPVVPFDLVRMFVGTEGAAFYAEILFRTVFVYVYTLVMLRWIGGRSVAQLSLIEFLLVIALGSAVGDAMFYPEVPLLHAMMVVTVVVVINKVIDVGIEQSRTVTKIIDGEPDVLMTDGRILHESLGQRHLGVSEIMAALRLKGIRNLGEVELAYLEPAGDISVFKANPPRAGLAIVPPLRIERGEEPADVRNTAALCCQNCGAVHAGPTLDDDLACPDCGATQWTLPKMPQASPSD